MNFQIKKKTVLNEVNIYILILNILLSRVINFFIIN